MNASIKHLTKSIKEIRNQNCLAYQDQNTKRCELEPIFNNSNLQCYPYGNFFVSEGLRGYVLKVQTKKRLGNFSFLDVLKSILDAKYSDEESKLVGKKEYNRIC